MQGIDDQVFHEDSRTRTDFLFDATALSINFSNISSSMPNNSVVREEFESLSVSVFQAIGTAVALGIIMVGTITGNILVILSVFTYKPLRNVQNIFLVSLAAADIAVAIFVMPFNLAYSILGNWVFGLHVCKLWLTCDVLCCTASILNLCAIALDRYWAIHDPINYAQKRTLNRVLCMILCVWVISTLISVPPLIGWNDWPKVFTADTPCQLTEEKGYVIYSASGSFFIPLVIMTAVYVKIFQTARNRIRVKAKAAANIIKKDMPTTSSIGTGGPTRTVSSVTATGATPKTVSSGVAKDAPRTDTDDSADIEMEERSSCEIDSNASTKGPGSADGTKAENAHGAKAENAHGTKAPAVTVRSYMEQKERICLQKERRAAQVLGIVMGVFVLCWLPFFTMYVILPFCESCYISQEAVNFITWLGYMNSALNPVIYTVFNTDFRKSFQRLLSWR